MTVSVDDRKHVPMNIIGHFPTFLAEVSGNKSLYEEDFEVCLYDQDGRVYANDSNSVEQR